MPTSVPDGDNLAAQPVLEGNRPDRVHDLNLIDALIQVDRLHNPVREHLVRLCA